MDAVNISMPNVEELRKNKTSKIRVGVLRGGPSGEFEISLKTGGAILEHMPSKYHPLDIYIDRKGRWHIDGMACENPEKILKHLDVVFNGLHGNYGEDGKVQRLLGALKIPYTGSDSLSSALAMNKTLTKKIFERANIRTPKWRSLARNNNNYLKTFEIWSELRKPLVVKPACAGSSLGVSIVEKMEAFTAATKAAFKHSPDEILIEEYIKGRELTCAVVDGLRPLPPIEIRTAKNSFFDYKSKYDGQTEEICPADLPGQLPSLIQELALEAHRALGLRHYSRTDMIFGEDGKIYILETNTLPGLTPESLLPKSLRAINMPFSEFIDHLINLALKKDRHGR